MHIGQPCESVLRVIMRQIYSFQLILKGKELRNLPRGALDKQQDDVLWATWCVSASQVRELPMSRACCQGYLLASPKPCSGLERKPYREKIILDFHTMPAG
ncbi:hypothetical protein AAES_125274 [Amazona aestiva]|uniref:Uncharacterized protein n=1 Tax=Amazona aestiva TaxID=12930 RepID=A0A0Q3UR67_AMAAE|nr:hypothetical protein AAES_125274 [Amazona aestiva]